MPATYTTNDGDRLDKICAKYYAQSGKTTEEVLYLFSNYGLTDMQAVFIAGVEILLPDIEPAPLKPEISLWD